MLRGLPRHSEEKKLKETTMVASKDKDVLDVLAPTRYLWRFNGPRNSRHNISNRNFLPLNRLPMRELSKKGEGITLFTPFPLRRFDLIHAFNRIPMGQTPFIIGFESHLPRAFGMEHTKYFKWLSEILASDRCRAVIAISKYSYNHFVNQHREFPWGEKLRSKLFLRYPNFPVPEKPVLSEIRSDEPIRLVFVGSHFGRKGGAVAVWLADIAHKKGLPVKVDIISSMETGAASWVDPLNPSYFDPEKELMNTLPNIELHGSLPNSSVLQILKNAHFSLLPTFSDTFGFSAIESMSEGVPVIATRQGVLPEFIHNDHNGILLDLETNSAGAWTHVARHDRKSKEYEDLFRSETKRLANDAFLALEKIWNHKEAYGDMRVQAHATARQMFSASDADSFWDDFYCDALAGNIAAPVLPEAP